MTKVDRIALAILVFGGVAVMSGVGGIHFSDTPATLTSLPRLAEVDAEGLRETAKHYDAETAMAEAREVTAHMVSEWKRLRALIHVCRIGEMIGEGYSDVQIVAWPRDNGLLTPSDLCSEPWARTFKGDLAAVAKRIVIIRQEQSMSLPLAPAASRRPGGWALERALDDIQRTAANRPKTWADEAGLIHQCRVRMMVDAGYTEAQIAVVPRGANGLLSPDESCIKEVNDNVENMMRSMAAADREIESKWHYTITTARAEASRATKDPVRGMIYFCRISEMLNVQGPAFIMRKGRATYTHEEVRALPRVNGLFEPSPYALSDGSGNTRKTNLLTDRQ
jgi:hypothetical protein